jgi:hypothetical protein
MSSVEFAPLSPDNDAARRIAFAICRLADRLGLPAGTRPETLIEFAMEQPEAVTPEEYSLIYLMRSPEALQ